MKINNYEFPKTSFLSIQKDLGLIVDKILKNERLKRLLYYTTSDALTRKPLDEDQSLSVLQNNIKIVPKLYVDGSVLSYIIISFDHFSPNITNPEFRDNLISFDIICHVDQWDLQDFKLRPYLIAAELDSMLDGKHLTGIGELGFVSADQLLVNDEFAGLSLTYEAIHGEDDKVNMPIARDNEQFIREFHAMHNR